LSADTLGRRFRVEEHSRFAALLEANGPLRFPTDSALPDPYHGLVEGVEGHLPVHDCMGCVIHLDEKPWGLLTLDALAPERFSSVELDALQSFGSLAAATVSVAGTSNGWNPASSTRASGPKAFALPPSRANER
jgi:anaerobic nitric oxide reductase transcription regulator